MVQSKDVTGNWKRAISWMAEHSSTNKIMVQSMGKMCCMHQWRAYSLLTLQFWFWFPWKFDRICYAINHYML
jgi:hypothetical protein